MLQVRCKHSYLRLDVHQVTCGIVESLRCTPGTKITLYGNHTGAKTTT